MKTLIAITCGDINGISYEIVLKAIADKKIKAICEPILIGSLNVLNFYNKRLKLNLKFFDFDLQKKTSANDFFVIDIGKSIPHKIQLGKTTKDSGTISLLSLKKGIEVCKKNITNILVTSPVSKEAISMCEKKFKGQTEFFGNHFHSKNFAMMMLNNKIRIVLATTHIPIQNVSKQISKELISKKLQLIFKSLKNDFKIKFPKIAVIGLNPHAGENGIIGNEEEKIIKPVLQKFDFAFGPFSSDAFFGNKNYKNYDAVFSMYHDQGLIPFKMLGIKDGINFTIGLPIVRTSPAHGTAFDIAGKNTADSSSLIYAILNGIKIWKSRN